MSKKITQEELLKLSEQEKAGRAQRGETGVRYDPAGVLQLQCRVDTVNAMWQRIMAKLSADGGAK